MSVLNQRMLWLKLSVAMPAVFATVASALASPQEGPTAPSRHPLAAGSSAMLETADRRSSAQRPSLAQNEPAQDQRPQNQPARDQAPQDQPAQDQTSSQAPGQFEVDEEAAERALERTLVVQGALLLPFGVAEIQPSFSYTRSELEDVSLLFQRGTGDPVLAESDLRRNILTADLFVRFGLPFDSQLELGLPYQYLDTEQVTEISRIGRNTVSDSSSGFGDFRLGAAKALLREGLWWPNLIARVTWDTDTGNTNARNQLGNQLGSGFNELSGSLTATKRQDPLVFIGSVSYTKTFEEGEIEPGDALGFSVGALLAASPETSLRLILSQTFRDEVKISGQTIEGSDQVFASLGFGASSIIGHGKFLDFSASTGLTDQTPDYSVGVTLVVRFDVPGLPF